ncbi:hypothetical protein A6A40_26210 (plasmid) [Azospirillum humicireducens]|uniref:Ribbon-helix-helix domain-containing protein n=1 Tax=Azospirillum humicireducens TaxID=1226968 RepID=A0A2R4VVQ7_9PROT|nr:ribbon-helix-helix domain-containing protein [Azospirillum humicireducens]AWB08502.1 hypothetical protein A6A40_26210 [Azospirillum humicireducens]
MLQATNKKRGGIATGRGSIDLEALMVWPQLSARVVPKNGVTARLRLEKAVWEGLDAIAELEGKPTQQLCAELEENRPKNEALSTTIRTFVLGYFRKAESA